MVVGPSLLVFMVGLLRAVGGAGVSEQGMVFLRVNSSILTIIC